MGVSTTTLALLVVGVIFPVIIILWSILAAKRRTSGRIQDGG